MKYIPELPENIIKEVNELGLNYDDKDENFIRITPNQNKTIIKFVYEQKIEETEEISSSLIYMVQIHINSEYKKVSSFLDCYYAKHESQNYREYLLDPVGVELNFEYDFMIDPLEEPKELVLFAINYFRLKYSKDAYDDWM